MRGTQSEDGAAELGVTSSSVGKWRSHDYKRLGTTRLFAALDIATGGHRKMLCPSPRQ